MRFFVLGESVSHQGGMWPADSVTKGASEMTHLLDELSPAQIREGIESVLTGVDVDEGLQWLQEVGVIAKVLPEMEATVSLKQEGNRKHKDVWEHTKLVVKQSIRKPVVRWGALLHDIGKVPTRRFTSKGVTFHGHAEVGARMFDKLAKRIEFPDEMRDEIRFLILYHLRSAQYESSWSESAIRRFHADLHEHMDNLLALSRADITSKIPGKRKRILYQIAELEQRVKDVVKKDSVKPPLPKGVGTLIMSELGVPPSKKLGLLKKELERLVSSGELEAYQESEYYVEWIRNQPDSFLASYMP